MRGLIIIIHASCILARAMCLQKWTCRSPWSRLPQRRVAAEALIPVPSLLQYGRYPYLPPLETVICAWYPLRGMNPWWCDPLQANSKNKWFTHSHLLDEKKKDSSISERLGKHNREEMLTWGGARVSAVFSCWEFPTCTVAFRVKNWFLRPPPPTG